MLHRGQRRFSWKACAPPSLTLDGAEFALGDPEQRLQLEDHLQELFGPHASVQQLIDTCSVDDVRLDVLRMSRQGAPCSAGSASPSVRTSRSIPASSSAPRPCRAAGR